MGITLKDIYEQRDMLRRGEEIARAAKQAEHRECLRDTFAAAALTGMLDKTDAGKDLAAWWPEMACQAAYRWADAMLRERAKTIHDAAPEARAQDLCTGDTTEPVAWAVMDGHEFMEFCTDKEEAKCAAGFYGDCPIVPLYRQPQPALTDDERTALRIVSSVFPSEKHAATLRGLLERLS